VKLRTKLLGAVVSVIVLLTVTLSILFSLLIGSSRNDQFHKHGSSVAMNLASNGRLGVMMGDSTQLSSIIESAFMDKEVRSVSFYDQNWRQLIHRGEELSPPPKVEQREAVELDSTDQEGKPVAIFRGQVYARQGDSAGIGSVQVGITLENLRADTRNSIVWSFIICIVFSLTGVFVVNLIMRILQPLLSGIELVATGDLTIRLEQKTNDEIGRLIKSLNGLVEGLRRTVEHIREMTLEISNQVHHITGDAGTMDEGMRRQAERSTEVASAVEEMTTTIIENSKNAVATAETAKKARIAAEQGGKVVEETILGMKRIAVVVNKSAETVKALGNSSEQIGEIIGVIDDIADQTNLLALNAAIEAARAGEQGRGFAVVADEVRRLAERTTKATKEIASMIKKIQSETQGAVLSMEEGTRQVGDGIKLADKAGASLHELVEISMKVTDMVSQIATASEQQSAASGQISKNVEEISNVTNQSTLGTQQIAQAAGDLSRLTEGLKHLVENFNISERDEVPGQKHSYSAGGAGQTKSGMAVRANGAIVFHEQE
jgi:methyl-accepting chemotaxis protein